MEEKKDIYIIGAGVSGLIAAYELEQEGFQPTIIERTAEVGGRVKTINEQGYALDLGFQVLLSSYPLVNKYLDLDALQLQKLESGALIYTNKKAYRIGDPSRDWKVLIPTIFAKIGSISDKLKILKLNKRLKNKSIQEIFDSEETSTLQYLVNFGFSSTIIESFFKPFFAGIFLEPKLQTSSRMFEFVYKMFGDGYAAIPKFGMGEISLQLRNKLQQTEFIFNSEVEEVTDHHILMSSGERKTHHGVILASNTPSLLNQINEQSIKWKACMCLYFEVDQTNIPDKTIALITGSDTYSNNLYAYKDVGTGKTVLSVTVLEFEMKTDQELIQTIIEEVKQHTGATKVNYIKHYAIKKALPDLDNLKTTLKSGENQVDEHLFVAGDGLLNGSLNAAMEAGRLAADALMKSYH